MHTSARILKETLETILKALLQRECDRSDDVVLEYAIRTRCSGSVAIGEEVKLRADHNGRFFI